MGLRYIAFRVLYELRKRTGLLKKAFPVAPRYQQFLKLEDWKQNNAQFFFKSKEHINIPKQPSTELQQRYTDLRNGKLLFFNSLLLDFGTDYDWITNPDTGYKYDITKHWTEIADFSQEAGDIKYVWEKSRFSYLYDVIRYDYHFNEDCAQFVFDEILSWIKANPINQGPNYYCSQEMSLRILNWTFALYYYKNSTALTEDTFNTIQFNIYWHIHHIYHNINFSRIAVRNNHAITETLTLFLMGILFPQFPNAAVIKQRGKQWFETEIAYQIYEDGTYLQYSMNYHRVVAQLLTWGILLSELNNEKFNTTVYDRARASLRFLRTCMDDCSGQLPNFGMNDGALFFKLNDCPYREYRNQLDALATVLHIDLGFDTYCEDVLWYGLDQHKTEKWTPANGNHSFPIGGYHIIREDKTLTFIAANNHRDRPHQADNLHLDVWHNGENILIDAGSYKYNTDDATLRYFSGTASHNTVMLSNLDQMQKGGRFIWYFWSQCVSATLTEENEAYCFSGEVSVYQYINRSITHTRKIRKQKGQLVWEVTDTLNNKPSGLSMEQIWHILPKNVPHVSLETKNEKAIRSTRDGQYSSLYGKKEISKETVFTTDGNILETTISIN
jgi:Heparinase II/III-like protein/Heparinase II/III N-terminus